MKRRLLFILVTGLLTVLAYGYAPAKEPVEARGTVLKYGSTFEGGKLYSAGQIKVVELTGDYRQMGRQYGSSPERRFGGDSPDDWGGLC